MGDHVAADRVQETTTTTGTGALTLGGVPDVNLRTFADAMAIGDTTFYALRHRTAGEWEFGLGTLTATTTLTRTAVLRSSAGAATPVSLSAGTKDVFITTPGAMVLWGTTEPAQLTADVNDWTVLNDEVAAVRFSTNNAARTITGLAGGLDGRLAILVNVGTFDAVLAEQSTLSLAANRFAAETIVTPGEAVILRYDGTAARWRLTGESGNRLDRNRRLPFFWYDFEGTVALTSLFPWTGAAVGGGTAASTSTNVDANHPGIWRLSSTNTANSGYLMRTAIAGQRIAGGEFFEIIIRPLNIATTTERVGFFDTGSSVDATDGVYVEIPTTGQAVLKCASNAARTTSPTIATLAINTWYRIAIEVNRAATAATATIYAEDGAVLGTQTVTANIPTAAGRECGAGIVATNSTTTTTALVDVDYIAHGWKRRGLVR